jgi:hypothetical protein
MRRDEFDLLSEVLEDGSVETTTREDNSADGCLSGPLEVCVCDDPTRWLWTPGAVDPGPTPSTKTRNTVSRLNR